MNIIKKLETDKNAMDALVSLLYFLPNVPLKALLDNPGAISVADSESAANILGRLQAEGLITVDANDIISLAPELICEQDIYEILPPPSYLQNKKIGETAIGGVFSAVKKSDGAMCEIWSQALKKVCEMLISNPESKEDPDLPRYYNRCRLACELLGENERAQFWERKLLDYYGINVEKGERR